MLVGLLLAAAAAVATGVASVWQAIGVRQAGAHGGSAADLVRLRHQPLYFAGLGLDLIGFVGAVGALRFLPLFVVQAVTASSVGVTAVIAALLGARIGRRGWIALATLGCGLVLLALSAAPEGVTEPSPLWRWVLLGCAVPVAAIGVLGSTLSGKASAAVLALAAGLGWAVMAIAARTLIYPHDWWQLAADPTVWAVAANGIAGVVLFAMALQAGIVTVVSAVAFVTEIVLPSAVGLLWLGDTARPGFAAVAAAGFVLAVIGVVALAGFTEPVLPGSVESQAPGHS